MELVNRLEEAGLLARGHDATDRRRALRHPADTAEDRLVELSMIHLEELRRLRPALQQILDQAARAADRSFPPPAAPPA